MGDGWGGEAKFIFSIGFLPAHTASPLLGSGWDFLAYIGIQSAHFLAIYSYIWKHDVRFYIQSLDFLPGLSNFKGCFWNIIWAKNRRKFAIVCKPYLVNGLMVLNKILNVCCFFVITFNIILQPTKELNTLNIFVQ